MPPDDPDFPDADLVSGQSCAGLSSIERTVVTLGLRDPLRSVPGPRRWFSWREPTSDLHLSDPRLETLRRFVVLLRHGRDIEGSGVNITAGFSPGQVHEAQALVARHRGG